MRLLRVGKGRMRRAFRNSSRIARASQAYTYRIRYQDEDLCELLATTRQLPLLDDISVASFNGFVYNSLFRR